MRTIRIGPRSVIAAALALSFAVSCSGSSSGNAEFLTADSQGLGGSIAAAGPGGTGTPATTTDHATDRAADLGEEIAAADLYRVEGRHLFLLNAWRGLAVVDLEQGTVLGRARLGGLPREMFVVGTRAFVLLEKHDGTGALVELELANPAAPVIAGETPLAGFPRTSRRVGDRIVTLSDSPEGSVVESFRIVPALTPVSTVSLGGIVEHVLLTDEILFAAENLPGVARIQLLDASSESGVIVPRGTVFVPGVVQDDDKLHAVDDELRVVTHEFSGGLNSLLSIVDVADPDAPDVRGELEFGYGERLFATRFSEERVYVVTFEQIDPLWIIDLSNPDAPMVTAELEVPGWSSQLVVRDDRLLALGMAPMPDWETTVSIFDVANPGAPFLASRIGLGASGSNALSDPRAFGVFDDGGLVLVPLTAPTPHLAVVAVEGNTLTDRGDIATSSEPLRGFPTQHGLGVLTDTHVVLADATSLATTASIEIAENVLDLARLTPSGAGEGRIVKLVQDGTRVRLGSLDVELWAEALHQHGNVLAVTGWDALGRAAYVVDHRGATPIVSSRIDLGMPGAFGFPTNTIGGGLLWFPGPSVLRAETLLTSGGRLVARGLASVPPDLVLGSGDVRDGFIVVDLENATIESRIEVRGASVTGATIDGERLALTLGRSAGMDPLTRPMLRHALHDIDLPSLTASEPIAVPGGVLARRGELVFTLDEQWAFQWSVALAVVAARIEDGVAKPLERRELHLGAYDLRVAGATLYYTTGSVGPLVTFGAPASFPFLPDGDLHTLRLDESLELGPRIDFGDVPVWLLLAEEDGALVVRESSIVERYDLTGGAAVLDWSLDVQAYARSARADGASESYLLSLGLGGEVRVP